MTPFLAAAHRTTRRRLAAMLFGSGLLVATFALVRSAEPKFLSDDPIDREPEAADAAGAKPWDIDLFYDLSYNLFVTTRRVPANIRAQNVNTIDEVPDSSWFTNRIGARAVIGRRSSCDGPAVSEPGTGPPPRWTIVHAREDDATLHRDFTGCAVPTGWMWFVPRSTRTGPTRRAATGRRRGRARRFFWALGYWPGGGPPDRQCNPEDDPEIAKGATRKRPSGKRTPHDAERRGEEDAQAGRPAPRRFVSYRGRTSTAWHASRRLQVQGTLPDDANDMVPHEHRRELRALRVFGAWTNLTDMKAGNTLDTIIADGGRGIVRHYLQDVGSTFGVGANGPHDWSEGWSLCHDGAASRRRLFTFGFGVSPWQTADYDCDSAIGRFEGDAFEPETWKPRVPTAAFYELRDDDAFWAARRVMAFSDEFIRALVKADGTASREGQQNLADVLIKRRDEIGRAYLTRSTRWSTWCLMPPGC